MQPKLGTDDYPNFDTLPPAQQQKIKRAIAKRLRRIARTTNAVGARELPKGD